MIQDSAQPCGCDAGANWLCELHRQPKPDEAPKPMGYSARQNDIARQSAAGGLHSRATIIGAMDHALETHASALRLLEAKIIALKERLDKMEAVLDGNAD